jgi:predicted TIM-barrel fold metal-dependent hydrolase
MPYYNVHSHIFTMENAPKKFLHLYMPDVAANFVDLITNTKAGANSVAWLLSILPSSITKRYASFLRIGKSNNPRDVFQLLKGQYTDRTMRIIALTMYMEECGAGRSVTGYEGQLRQVVQVKEENPDRLFAFLGVDPRWQPPGQTLLQKVQDCFTTRVKGSDGKTYPQFAGLKIYPSTGFYVFDKRLMEVMEWAAENEVPVLTHCNYLGGVYNNDASYIQSYLNLPDPYNNNQRYPAQYDNKFRFGSWLIGTNKSRRNLNTCSYFLEPESFKTMLTSIQKNGLNLKICFAHYGGSDHILAADGGRKLDESKLHGANKKNWCTQIRELMMTFPQVYTDISYAVANQEIFDPVFNDLDKPVFTNRIMFGTDFFLSERENSEANIYNKFLVRGQRKLLPNGNTAWDQVAEINIEAFLQSKFS